MHVPENRIGFACASLTSGLTFGILIGSLMGSGIYTQLSPEDVLSWGWRMAFIIGGVFGFLTVYLRRWLHETPVFEAMKEKKELSREIPLKKVLKDHRPGIILSMLVTWMLTAGVMVLILMTPTLIQTQFGILPEVAFKGNNLAALSLVFGCLLGGYTADKFGYAKALLIGSLILLITNYALYIDLTKGGEYFMPLYALAGLTVGVIGIVPTVMIHAFPPVIRFSGISFSYNMAYAIFGAVTPPLISYLSSHAGGLASAHYLALTTIVSIGISIYLIRKK